ncbi:helix-turn-helix domain-containing protein [Streptomyces yunnanensis]|uniref:Helix-turn-helix domain-containing protein n=1 Tax=Streptomyces yunnanensis TaxID=156453 RepID=A0ABY8A967_9ACTN|nr:helix-turn-helix domain-containing protein [Streptomyces yunnanensis]WEB41527.1 helix-turn-helix domain-containing protein [Streptomyces yunnanensis]
MPQTITDTAAAALYFHVAPTTVRSWIKRGHVEHHGHDRRGRALVDLHEIRDYLHTRQAARQESERTG